MQGTVENGSVGSGRFSRGVPASSTASAVPVTPLSSWKPSTERHARCATITVHHAVYNVTFYIVLRYLGWRLSSDELLAKLPEISMLIQ